MSYKSTGSVYDDIAQVLSAGRDVASDPHIGELTCHIVRLNAMEEGTAPGPFCNVVPVTKNPGSGIGLRHAMPALRQYVRYRENPWPFYLGVAAVAASIYGLGYIAGRDSKRGKK